VTTNQKIYKLSETKGNIMSTGNKRSLDKDLKEEFKEAKALAKKEFESEDADPTRNLNVSGAPGGSPAIFNNLELGEKVVEKYKFVFLEKGRGFTQGYVEGRKGRMGNLFDRKYKAAKRALSEYNN